MSATESLPVRSREFAPERVDLDSWLILDARKDGGVLVVCRECQTAAERERVDSLR